MKAVPKYVIDILNRSNYEFDKFVNHPDYAVGYTLRIKKSTPYTKIETLANEIKKLKKWADRHVGHETVLVLHVPKTTHYCDQFAYITIFDPLMLKLEQYIKE